MGSVWLRPFKRDPLTTKIDDTSINKLYSFSGDEIFAVNGSLLQGLSHSEAISIFKQIRSGPVVLQTGRRNHQQLASKQCHSLTLQM